MYKPAATSYQPPATSHLGELFSGWGWGMVAPLRFYFLVVVLQAPLPLAGLVEGIALGGPHIVRALLSGRLSGASARLFSPLGYLMENVARPLLAFAGSWLGALPVVLGEGAGRGLARSEHEGEGWPGWARSVGGVLGAVSGALLLVYFTANLPDVFLWSAVPGALAVAGALLWVVVGGSGAGFSGVEALGGKIMGRYGARFWLFTGASAAFALGNVSVSFFLLRLASFEQPPYMLALAFALYLGAAALMIVPARWLRRRWSDLPRLLTGYSILLLATLAWILVAEAWQGWALLAVAGVGVALSSGLSDTLIRAYTDNKEAAGAHRAYHGAMGLAALFGNVFAALFWVAGGPGTAFGYAAWGLGLGLALMLAWLPWLKRGFVE